MQQPLNNEVKMMRSFNNYIKSKELFAEDAARDIGRTAMGSVSLGEKQKEQLGNLFKVIELISDGYMADLKSFLIRMSKRDEEIEKLVEKIKDDGWAGLHQAGTKATSGFDDENNLSEPGSDSGFDEPDQLAQHDTGGSGDAE
jgi:hypothetical protein